MTLHASYDDFGDDFGDGAGDSEEAKAPLDLNDPAVESGLLRAAHEHVSFWITDALVWLPSSGPALSRADADIARARSVLTNARQYIADTLARIDTAKQGK